MKSIKKIAAVVAISLITISLSAQSPPPPNNDGGGGDSNAPSGGSGNTVGGNAPIGGGLFLLLGLGAAYGSRKLYELRKEKLEE